MPQISTEQLIKEWQTLLDSIPESIYLCAQQLAQQHYPELAASFYKHMLEDPVAA